MKITFKFVSGPSEFFPRRQIHSCVLYDLSVFSQSENLSEKAKFVSLSGRRRSHLKLRRGRISSHFFNWNRKKFTGKQATLKQSPLWPSFFLKFRNFTKILEKLIIKCKKHQSFKSFAYQKSDRSYISPFSINTQSFSVKILPISDKNFKIGYFRILCRYSGPKWSSSRGVRAIIQKIKFDHSADFEMRASRKSILLSNVVRRSFILAKRPRQLKWQLCVIFPLFSAQGKIDFWVKARLNIRFSHALSFYSDYWE